MNDRWVDVADRLDRITVPGQASQEPLRRLRQAATLTVNCHSPLVDERLDRPPTLQPVGGELVIAGRAAV